MNYKLNIENLLSKELNRELNEKTFGSYVFFSLNSPFAIDYGIKIGGTLFVDSAVD